MTLATATLLRPGSLHHSDSSSIAVPTGTISVSVEGNVIVFQGLKAAAINDPADFDNQEIYSVVKDTTVFAAGQTVYWDPVNTLPATTGFIRMGKCVKAAASGDGTVQVRLLKDARGASQSQVAAGTALTNSTTPTTMGSITIPPNYLQAGDRLKIRAQAIAPLTNSTDTLQLNLQLTPGTTGSAVNLAATAAVDVANNDIGYFDFEVVIRTVGATGTMVGCGVQALGTPGTVTAKPQALASSTIDTTQSQIVGVQGTWSVANAGDSARLDVLNVELIRA